MRLEPTSGRGPVIVAALLAPANSMWFDVWSLIEALLHAPIVKALARRYASADRDLCRAYVRRGASYADLAWREDHRVSVAAHYITLGGMLIDADGGTDVTMRRLGIDNRGIGHEAGDIA